MNPIIADVLSRLPTHATKFERFLHIIKVLQPVSRPELAEAATPALDTTEASVFTMLKRANQEDLLERIGANKGVRFELKPDALTRFHQIHTRSGPAPKTGTKVKMAAQPPAPAPAAEPKPAAVPTDEQSDLCREILWWLREGQMPAGGWNSVSLSKVLYADPKDIAATLRELRLANCIERHTIQLSTGAVYCYTLPGQDISAVRTALGEVQPAADQQATVKESLTAHPSNGSAAAKGHSEAPIRRHAESVDTGEMAVSEGNGGRVRQEAEQRKTPCQEPTSAAPPIVDLTIGDISDLEPHDWVLEHDQARSAQLQATGDQPDDLAESLRRQMINLDDLIGEACDHLAPHRAIRCIHSASASLRHALKALGAQL